MKSLSNKRPTRNLKSTINLYVVKASVYFENKIYLRYLGYIDLFKKTAINFPHQLKIYFAHLNYPRWVGVVFVFVNKLFAKGFVFYEYLFIKFTPLIDWCDAQLKKIKYWLINPGQINLNGGVAAFSYGSNDAKKIFSFVALVHAILFALILIFSSLHESNRPDVMIELEEPPRPLPELPSSIPEKALSSQGKSTSNAALPSDNIDSEIVKAQELKRLERQKELDLERERKKELEREKQKQRELDRELQIEKKRDLDRERQKVKELELERQKELERERLRVRELEQEKKKELERERIKAKELEQEKKKELERERVRARELEQEKKREQDSLREQERQQKIKDQQQRQEEKQRDRLAESKKLDKDGTLPPPPSGAPPTAPAVASSSAPSSSLPAAPLPSGSTPPSSSASAAASASSSSGGSISASVSNAGSSTSALDSDAKALTQNNAKPGYPLLAAKMKIQGRVILVVDVSENGTVNKISVAESSGHESLDKSALETVKNWKFAPARKNGVTVSQVIRVPITFSLKNH